MQDLLSYLFRASVYESSSMKALQRYLQDNLQTLAEAYAEDGVERLAGKNWRELEREQQFSADADIAGIFYLAYTLPCMSHTLRQRMPNHVFAD